MIEIGCLKPSGKDPILKFLLNHGQRRVYFFISLTVLFVLLPVIASIFNRDFINEKLEVDAFHDFGYYIRYLLLLPFFIYFFPYYFNGMEKTIKTLIDRNVLIISDTDYYHAIQYSNRLFSHWLVTISPYTVSIVSALVSMFSYTLAGYNNWNSAAELSDISFIDVLSMLPWFPFFYFLAAIILRIGLTYFGFKRFLSGNVDIQPLHPDNCGGLSPLGNFSIRISSAGIGIGIPIVLLLIFDVTTENLSYFSATVIMHIIVYSGSLIVLFFLPLLGARGSMLKAKNNELRTINERYQTERKKMLSSMNSAEVSVNLNVTNLEGLMKLYGFAKSMPVYPFNAVNVIRFLGSILWPVLLMLLQVLVQGLS